jgi:hypothetical protein
MTAWSHLPNAAHIDKVLVDFNNHHAIFKAVRDMRRNDSWHVRRNAAWSAARTETRSSARDAEYIAERSAAWSAATAATLAGPDSRAARGAALALIAYDHASEYMTMTPDQALVWGELRGDHAYTLLREYLQVQAHIEQTIMNHDVIG